MKSIIFKLMAASLLWGAHNHLNAEPAIQSINVESNSVKIGFSGTEGMLYRSEHASAPDKRFRPNNSFMRLTAPNDRFDCHQSDSQKEFFRIVETTPVWTADNHNLEVYTDYPVGSWQNWSWAHTREMQSTTHVHSFSYAIRAAFNPWQAIALHNINPWQPKGDYAYLHFHAHGGSTGGQQFYVQLKLNGIEQTAVPLTNYAVLQTDSWSSVSIPLADLGYTRGSQISDILFIERLGLTIQDFWIDDIFISAPLPAEIAMVEVDSNRKLRPFTRLHTGLNVAAWDPLLGSTSTLTRLSEAAVGFLRYPGGSTSDNYDWFENAEKSSGYHYASDTATFLNTADTIGADKLITINYGSGSPAEAAAWLSHVNNTLSNSVAYWCIGNECFGSWEYDTNAIKQDALTYSLFTSNCITAMRTVDSSVKIGVAGTWHEADYPQRVSVINPRTQVTNSGWSAVLLKTLSDMNIRPDFYEIHEYPSSPSTESDTYLLNCGGDWNHIIDSTKQMLVDYFGDSGTNIPIFITENNSPSANAPGKQTTGIINAVYLCDSAVQACLAGASAYMWWDMHNGADTSNNNSPTLNSQYNYGDYGILSPGPIGGIGNPVDTPYPTFYALKLLGICASNAPTMVETVCTHPLLRAYAFREKNPDKLKLLLINTSHSLSINTEIHVENFSLPASLTQSMYNETNIVNNTDITLTNITSTNSSFSMILPPYSISVFQ